MRYPTQEEIEEALAGMELEEGETEFIPPSVEDLEKDYRLDEAGEEEDSGEEE